MKKYTEKVKNFVKKHYIISGLIALVLLFVIYKIFASGNGKKELFTVKRADVIQKVIVNGKTKSVHAVDLAFDVSGTVTSAYVDIGSRVTPGQALVSLDSASLNADLLKAKANLLSDQAKLDELKKGTRPEEIAVYQTQVNNAQVTLSDSQKNLADKVKDIINNNVDQLFSNPHSASPQFNLYVADSQLKSDLNLGRFQIESMVNNWDYAKSSDNAAAISTFLEKVGTAVNNPVAGSGLAQTTIDGYRTSISSARATFISAVETLNSAKSALDLAQKNLSLKQSGNTPETINSQQAKVMQDDAEEKGIEADLYKRTLRSPQSGVVTKQDAKVGEAVTVGKNVVSIISDSDLEIESNVSEVSIGKVALGNPVNITFDAFPDKVFSGTVTYIEPAETIVDGVVNYKVTVAFSEKYPDVKSGLTSRLEIITGTKQNVLVIPEYAISGEGTSTFVLKSIGKKSTEKTSVTVGLRGQDGMVEVISGLDEGTVIDTNPAAK